MAGKLIFVLCVLSLIPAALWGADVHVINGDPAGMGFNDPTPATPVGGNPGTTVGQQALNVFQQAANVWGAKLVSKQPILVIAFFTPLTCSANSAVLGAAGANWYFANIPAAAGGKPLPADSWYPAALAEKITRQDIVADPNDPFEVFALFNSQLGQPGCLDGSGWYYGLDNREPANRIDLLAVVLHEFGHGLGFSVSPTNSKTGTHASGYPSVWESNMLDLTTGKRWLEMTNAERAASARNTNNLVWAGQKASNVVPGVLDFRTEVDVLDPSSLGSTEAQKASFGPELTGPMRAPLALATKDGCDPFPAGTGLAGKIALIQRGTCTFVTKVLNAQNAGAVGVIIDNNTATGLPGMGGADPNVMVPSVGVSQAFGAALRAQPSAFVVLRRNPTIRAGAEGMNYPRLYAPAAYASGSSVSHWDTSLTPNVLMEPFINTDLVASVKNPDDLSKSLLVDIGW